MKPAFTPLSSDDGLPVSLKSHPKLSAWLKIVHDGGEFIEVRTGKVELGQNIVTALARIAARALIVPMTKIKVVPACTRISPDESVTSGSLSIQHSGMALRMACRDAREKFITHAALMAGVDRTDIQIRNGVFRIAARELGSYWTLVEGVDFDSLIEPTSPDDREDDWSASDEHVQEPALGLREKVQGQYGFIHDMMLPAMLHGRMLRPPSIGAQLDYLDEHLIQGLVGPVQVFRDGSLVGVLAEQEHIAVAAIERLASTAQWREQASMPLQHHLDAWLREQPCDTKVYDQRISTAKQKSAATGITTYVANYFKPFLKHASIGPSCAVACLAAEGELSVWSHTQGIYNLRDDLSIALGIPQDAIVVQHVPGAGCYGHNGADDVAFDAAWLALQAPGRPVRVQWSRAQEFCWSPQSPPMSVQLQVDVDIEGEIMDWRTDVWSPGHSLRPGRAPTSTLLGSWYQEQPSPWLTAINAPMAAGGGAERNIIPCYDIPCSALSSHRVLHMPIRTSSLRSLGAFANVFAIEAMMDDIAFDHAFDPIAYRLSLSSDIRAIAVMEAAREMSGWKDRHEHKDDVGWGFGYARYKNKGAYCAVVARVLVTNTVTVKDLFIAVDVGEVIDEDGVVQQIEGGAIQACSWIVMEQANFDDKGLTDAQWGQYPIMRFTEIPAVHVNILSRPEQPALGAGEPSIGPTAGAIGNAVKDALGLRVTVLPLTFDNISRVIEEKE